MKKKKVIGYTTGVFDLFHIGHLNILKKAKSHCDKLIVGVTTDDLSLRIKGKVPIISFEERCEILKSIIYVDKVVAQAEIDELRDWEILNFDIIFKGDDWEGTEKWNNLEKEFMKNDVKVHFLPYTKTTSSTMVRDILEKF